MLHFVIALCYLFVYWSESRVGDRVLLKQPAEWIVLVPVSKYGAEDFSRPVDVLVALRSAWCPHSRLLLFIEGKVTIRVGVSASNYWEDKRLIENLLYHFVSVCHGCAYVICVELPRLVSYDIARHHNHINFAIVSNHLLFYLL